MKILVVSDSHGRIDNLKQVIRKEAPDKILHMGDIMGDLEELQAFAGVDVVAVRGNCDGFCALPLDRVVDINGHKIFMTHGHAYGVNWGIGELRAVAREKECEAALYMDTPTFLTSTITMALL